MNKPVIIVVSLLMSFLLSAEVYADVLASGKIKNIDYELRNDTLFFSGIGKMPVIHGDNGWLSKYSIAIHHIVIGEGITEVNSIGRNLTSRRVSRSGSASNYTNDFECGLPNIKSVTLPSTLKKIGNNAFSFMRIESIRLPEGLEEIGREAFYGTQITSVRLPESTKKIGYQAFSSCKSLLCVDFNCAKVSIGSGCFFTSKVLRMLLHGNNVVSIATDSFRDSPFEVLDENQLLDALRSDGLEFYVSANIVPRNEFTGNEEQYERLRRKLVNDYYDAEYQKAEVALKLDTFTCGRYNRKTGVLPLSSTNYGSFDVPLKSVEDALQFTRMFPELLSNSKAKFEPAPDGNRVRFLSLTISFNGTDLTLHPRP